MSHNRLRPVFAVLVLLGLALVARLFQVQILEHDVWASEAARLVFQGRELPYRRGRILDAGGRVLARDEERRSVVLVYREFRRKHPLGQVAHARSLLEGRPVSLVDARVHLAEWARELVELRPAELRDFARGREPARDATEERLRLRRVADLVFYVRRLLELDERDEWNALLAEDEHSSTRRSFLELAARVRHRSGAGGGEASSEASSEASAEADVEAEWHELEQRLRHSLERLDLLAHWIQPASGAEEPGERDALTRLVDVLEEARRSVEDITAAKLFAEATGFAPGRVEEETLLECFDHAWIAELLGWDRVRLAEWAHTVRAGWQRGWRDGECLPRLLWQLVLEPAPEPAPSDFLDRLGVVYEPEGALLDALEAGPRPWREVDELAVFADLENALEADVPESALALGRRALPIQIEELRADPDAERLLPEGSGAGSFRALLAKSLTGRGRVDVDTLLGLATELDEQWDRRFQETLRRALDETLRAAGSGERGADGGLLLAEENRERAAERAEYFLKDYGMRRRTITSSEPSYDIVYLLTRYEADFPGFQVREDSARELVPLGGDDEKPADLLVGRVVAPTLLDLLPQRAEAARLRKLKARPDREEEEAEELRRLIGEVRLPNEVKGASGIEAFFEPELAGRPGFSEARGLTELFGSDGERKALRDPVDGQDVVLTLQVGLQAAAQRSLRHPAAADDEPSDDGWQQNPVGAIVLLSLEGDVLAAASEPDDQSLIDPLAKEQRLVPIERTLGKPTFLPPGSVFKPFVAAWALDHGLDPAHTVTCGPIERGGFGYKTLLCANPHGHGSIALHQALVQSCNGYFAWLGETLNTNQFAELCADFGFGEPTGVRRAPPWDEGLRRRTGLREDVAGLAAPKNGELSESARQMAANGLAVVESTPMQLARAMLALATGEKCQLRLAQRVGERELPRGAREPLPIRAQSLDFVREAMRGVADDAAGTAHGALSHGQLGFHVAVKTGSADLQSRRDRQGKSVVQKHAWVAGWAPARDPKLVFVVFEHATMKTSTHGAIYLARQLLLQPEVLTYLADCGVDISGVAAR